MCHSFRYFRMQPSDRSYDAVKSLKQCTQSKIPERYGCFYALQEFFAVRLLIAGYALNGTDRSHLQRIAFVACGLIRN
jgi:hypothetical protein